MQFLQFTHVSSALQVKVCIIDSGAQANHPDLAGNIVKGFSTIDGEDPNNFNDDWGHGTHVAGTVAALGNNAVGVTGVAWKVRFALVLLLSLSSNRQATICTVVSVCAIVTWSFALASLAIDDISLLNTA